MEKTTQKKMDKKERAEIISSLMQHPGWGLLTDWIIDRQKLVISRLTNSDVLENIESVRHEQGRLRTFKEIDKTIAGWKNHDS